MRRRQYSPLPPTNTESSESYSKSIQWNIHTEDSESMKRRRRDHRSILECFYVPREEPMCWMYDRTAQVNLSECFQSWSTHKNKWKEEWSLLKDLQSTECPRNNNPVVIEWIERIEYQIALSKLKFSRHLFPPKWRIRLKHDKNTIMNNRRQTVHQSY